MRALHMIHSLSQLPAILPAPTSSYGLVVVNAGFNAAALDVIREAFPQAALLKSVNAHSIPTYGTGNRIFDDLRFNLSRHQVIDLVSLETVGVAERTRVLDFSLEAAEDLAEWALETAADNLLISDGIYLDDCWGNLPLWVESKIPDADVLFRWPAYRDHLLRCLGGAAGRFYANTAGWYPRAGDLYGLNGVCCEASHFEIPERLALYQEMSAAGIEAIVDWNVVGGAALDIPAMDIIPGDLIT